MKTYDFTEGHLPLLISMPHVGTALPPDIEACLTEAAKAVPDTDWYVERLYNFAGDMGASLLRANFSRTVVDLNRGVERVALYPGKSETTLCPLTTFDNEDIYAGPKPDVQEIRRRIQNYWQPYHDKIRKELDRLHAKFGYALLWDAHSIKTIVPRFFDGKLPDLNIGTGNGSACPEIIAQAIIAQKGQFSTVLNGRFKGGYITRHYGTPDQNITAVQMEISQDNYMDGNDFSESKAEQLRPVLKNMIQTYLESTQ